MSENPQNRETSECRFSSEYAFPTHISDEVRRALITAMQKWNPDRIAGAWYDTEYASSLDYTFNESPESFARIKHAAEGKNLLDLGCGHPNLSLGLEFFGEKCAAHYMGVDAHNIETEIPVMKGYYGSNRNAVLIRADMLDVLREMPSDSSNVLMSGVDDYVLGRNFPEKKSKESTGPEIGEILLKEMERVCLKGGFIILEKDTAFRVDAFHRFNIAPYHGEDYEIVDVKDSWKLQRIGDLWFIFWKPEKSAGS